MSTPNLNTLTDTDIDAMDEATLRDTLRRALASRAEVKRNADAARALAKKDAEIRAVLLPRVAGFVEALAERAGLQDDPSVRAIVSFTGDHCYPQWAKALPATLPSHEGLADAGAPTSHLADMAYSMEVFDAIARLKGAVDFGGKALPKGMREPLALLISTVEEGMARFATQVVPPRAERPITLRRSTDEALVDRFHDILQDLSFAMDGLRRDLLASYIDTSIRRLYAAIRESDALAEKATPPTTEARPIDTARF